MLNYTKKKEGLLGRYWNVQPQHLGDEVVLDRLDLSDIPARPSAIYVDIPAGLTFVHKDSRFDTFYTCTAIDGHYVTDVSKVQVSPIYVTHETLGENRIQCAQGFDFEVVYPDCPAPIPAKVAVFLDYHLSITNHEKLVAALHARVPVSLEALQDILQEGVRVFLKNAFESAIGSRQLTLEQLDGLISGEAGSEIRRQFLAQVEQLAIRHGLHIECGPFYRKELFGSSALTGLKNAREKEVQNAIAIKELKDKSKFLQTINEEKMAIERSDRALEESRKKD